MNNKLIFICITVLCGLLVGCGSQQQKKIEPQTYIVKPETVHKTLYFSGTIQPLKESTLTSPIDAVVETVHTHYGQWVKKGDVIFTLNSSELQKQYNDTLTDYLKAKDNFSIAKAKFSGTQELWDAGLISKNNFLSEKSNLATAQVSLMQSTRKLTEMIEKMDDGNKPNLSNLNIAEFDKVRQALITNHNLIHLKAPNDGVLLYPPKSTDDKSSKLSVGSTIKAGQVLGLVGDLSGISVEIDVPEIDIDKIRAGMPAKITGIALGKQVLKGQLVAVNAQASNVGGSALPSFSAIVEVKALNEVQRAWIKVGMSASIEIPIDGAEQLLIPISAITQTKGKSVVKLKNKNGSTTSRIISTGIAQADKVVVASGLQIGDVVAYD